MSEYSNQTLHEILVRLEKKVDDTLDQTKLTNGRVRKLEVWKGFITGGITLLSIIVGYLFKFIT